MTPNMIPASVKIASAHESIVLHIDTATAVLSSSWIAAADS